MASDRHHFEIFADHFQFHLHDEAAAGIRPSDWVRGEFPQAPRRFLLAAAEGALGVGTFRNMTVPVDLEVRDGAPDDVLDDWDFVADSGIRVASGRLAIRGCTEYLPNASRVMIPAGSYRARVFYGGLSTVSANKFEGRDHYKVVLWPGLPIPGALLKYPQVKRGG